MGTRILRAADRRTGGDAMRFPHDFDPPHPRELDMLNVYDFEPDPGCLTPLELALAAILIAVSACIAGWVLYKLGSALAALPAWRI